MKTNIYIDAANIILSSRDSGLNLDMMRLISYLIDKYKANVIVYFTAKFEEHDKLYTSLKEIDVEIVFKESYREKNRLKANCDVEISHRVTLDIERNAVDAIVLVSGDGDFVSLLDYAKYKIKSVTCLSSHPRHTSSMIKTREYLNIIYISDIISLVQKREIPGTH